MRFYYALKSQTYGRRGLGAGRPNGPDTRGAHAIRPVNTEVFRTRLHASRQQFPSLFEARHSLMDEAVRKPASKSSPCPRASSRSVLTGRRPCNPPAPPQDEISPRNNLETRRAARRDGFDTCGLPGVCLGDPGTARSGHVPGSCPSLSCQGLHARAKRGWRATRPSPRKNRDTVGGQHRSGHRTH